MRLTLEVVFSVAIAIIVPRVAVVAKQVDRVLHLPYLQLHASEAKKVIAAAISYDQSCSG